MAPKKRKPKKQHDSEEDDKTTSTKKTKPEKSQENGDAGVAKRPSKRKTQPSEEREGISSPPQERGTSPPKRSSKRKTQPAQEGGALSPKRASKRKTIPPEGVGASPPKRASKRKPQPPKEGGTSSDSSPKRANKRKAQPPQEREGGTSPKKPAKKNKGTSSNQEVKKRTKAPTKEPAKKVKKEDKEPSKKASKTSTKTNSGKGDAKAVSKKVVKTKGKKKTVKTEGGEEEGETEVTSTVKEELGEDLASTESEQGMTKMVCSEGMKFLGAHMGIAGGLDKAVIGASEIGAKSFALFLRSQRQWQAKPLDDKVAEKFRAACKEHKFSPWHILPHGSYLLNCGSPNPETLQKTRDTLTDELKRCEKLGLALYNFHPGSTCGQISVDECLDKIGETLNLVHKQTNSVMTVVENMSRQGNTVGGKFEELRGIIDRVEDKSRVGVCLDTCHAFAAGFDLSTESGYESMMDDFDKIVGLKYLKAVHLNDSKGKVGSHLDRHENIGKGFIGLKTFRRLMNDPRFNGIPIVLETPAEEDTTYEKEIRLLYSMQDAKK
ncbi:probable endonuclease 4 [Amphiura filiformis]|uniref:probable endonuclease 4 n=1 Tax=Amphiura filiformis TaxID=82378 RepID=UPI003B21A835